MASQPTEVHYFGEHKNLRYNAATRRLCPSDCGFTFLTLALILIPSSVCLFYVIPFSRYEVWLKVVLTIVNSLSLALCLYYLLKCTYTEPGIIPSLSLEGNLASGIKKAPKSSLDYYAEYLKKEDLDRFNIQDPATRFY